MYERRPRSIWAASAWERLIVLGLKGSYAIFEVPCGVEGGRWLLSIWHVRAGFQGEADGLNVTKFRYFIEI
jgi:hypothetical protein